MNESARFPDSLYDRIAAFLPAELHASYYRYVAHVRTLRPDDDFVVIIQGMGILALIARQVPEAIATEREKFLGELARLCGRHETATAHASADVRALFAAQQKLLEQNIGTWQSREQQAAQALDRIAKRFEEAANHGVARLNASSTEIQVTTKEHHAAAQKAQQWVSRVSLNNRLWPCIACGASGALLGVLTALWLKF